MAPRSKIANNAAARNCATVRNTDVKSTRSKRTGAGEGGTVVAAPRRTRSMKTTAKASTSSALVSNTVATGRITKRIKPPRVSVSQPMPALLNANFLDELDSQEKRNTYFKERGFYWCPKIEGTVKIDDDEWKPRLHDAITDFSRAYPGEDALRKGQITSKDAEIGVHYLMSAVHFLYEKGAVLHYLVDPTIKASRVINQEARDMEPEERLEAMEDLLKIDKKLCEHVIVTMEPLELIKILVAAPKVIMKRREATWRSNMHKRGQKSTQ